MSEATITLDDRDEALMLFGSRDQHLRLLRDALGVRFVARGETVQIDGDELKVGKAERVFQQLRLMLRKQGKLSPEDVRTVIDVVEHGDDREGPQNLTTTAEKGGRRVRPRTDGQARYVKAMRDR